MKTTYELMRVARETALTVELDGPRVRERRLIDEYGAGAAESN